jgi:hypothetical protein
MAYPCGQSDNDNDVSPYMTIMIKIFYLCQILYGVVTGISHKKMTRMAIYHHVWLLWLKHAIYVKFHVALWLENVRFFLFLVVLWLQCLTF